MWSKAGGACVSAKSVAMLFAVSAVCQLNRLQSLGHREAPTTLSQCHVCESEHRAAIELGLCFGTPQRVLAKRYGPSVSSIQAHNKNHLTPQLRAAVLMARRPEEIDLDELARKEGESVISQIVMQRARLSRLAELATDQGHVHQAVAAERAIGENLKLMSRLLGQLVTH